MLTDTLFVELEIPDGGGTAPMLYIAFLTGLVIALFLAIFVKIIRLPPPDGRKDFS